MKSNLIKKLRLKRGCQYILLFPKDSISDRSGREIAEALNELGFRDSLIVQVATNEEVKVIEKGKQKLSRNYIIK